MDQLSPPKLCLLTEKGWLPGVNSPLGRFCQYKLMLKSDVDNKSPLIREIAVANTVPNLTPKVESVTIARVAAAGKQGFFKISYNTKDDNDDKLIYKTLKKVTVNG